MNAYVNYYSHFRHEVSKQMFTDIININALLGAEPT
jgi:hypothetical protein